MINLFHLLECVILLLVYPSASACFCTPGTFIRFADDAETSYRCKIGEDGVQFAIQEDRMITNSDIPVFSRNCKKILTNYTHCNCLEGEIVTSSDIGSIFKCEHGPYGDNILVPLEAKECTISPRHIRSKCVDELQRCIYNQCIPGLIFKTREVIPF